MKVNLPEVTLEDLVKITAKYSDSTSMQAFRALLNKERPDLMGVVQLQMENLPVDAKLPPAVFFISGFMYGASIFNELLEKDDTPKVTLT